MNKLFNSKMINVEDLNDTVLGYKYIVEKLERYMTLTPNSIIEINIYPRVIGVNYELWNNSPISEELYKEIDTDEFLKLLNE